MSKQKRHAPRDIQAPPQAALPIRQQGPTAVKALLAFLSAIILVTTGVGYYAVGKVGADISNGTLNLGGEKGMEAADGAPDILLVGSDSRTDAQGNPLTQEEIDMLHAGDEEADNTDTIMVIRIPNDGSSATAISIPRDTYIHDPAIGNLKINGVYSYHKSIRHTELIESGAPEDADTEQQAKDAGRKGLIDAVSRLSGITIEHYAEIGLLGFVLLTDAVGGVDVCLNADTTDEYSGANFTAGIHTLNGPEGLAFVRQRHGLPRGDLDRIVRQQAYMASLVSKVLSSGTITNPVKLNDLGNAVTRSVAIDQGWDVMSLALQLQNLAGGNVQFNTIPVTSADGTGDNGESVVTIDVDEVRAFFDELLSGEAPAEAPPSDAASSAKATSSNAEVIVLNATTTSGLAAQVGGFLKTEGYKVTETSNAPDGMYTQSQVLAADTNNPDAVALAEKLGGVPINQSPSLDANTIAVVAAYDYAGPTGEAAEAADATQNVGQAGEALSEENKSPVIDAGGDGPRCVN